MRRSIATAAPSGWKIIGSWGTRVSCASRFGQEQGDGIPLDSGCQGSELAGQGVFKMKIRAGYEISYDCPQPTPMILTLSVHPSRFFDLQTPDLVRFDPTVPANTYHDGFGNFCHVITAPTGRLTVSADFLVQDSGAPDEVAPEAVQHPLQAACGASGLCARQPLL
jgi:hypothetical protein